MANMVPCRVNNIGDQVHHLNMYRTVFPADIADLTGVGNRGQRVDRLFL